MMNYINMLTPEGGGHLGIVRKYSNKGGTALGYKCCSFKSDFAVYQQLGGLRQDSNYYQLIDFRWTGGIL